MEPPDFMYIRYHTFPSGITIIFPWCLDETLQKSRAEDVVRRVKYHKELYSRSLSLPPSSSLSPPHTSLSL